MVISGGDGYEDFSCNSSNAGVGLSNGDAVGREDSTNHLLLWQV